ncbi:hypothetical protein C8J57DRAFT_1610037 [Mycena rebaudengoi]|nr:hypothetical protein C8J57DRAFT_1610037 [Mycena rebaudengoi]
MWGVVTSEMGHASTGRGHPTDRYRRASSRPATRLARRVPEVMGRRQRGLWMQKASMNVNADSCGVGGSNAPTSDPVSRISGTISTKEVVPAHSVRDQRYELRDSTCILDCPPLHAPSPRLHAIVVVPHESSLSLAILRPHPRRKLAILASGAEERSPSPPSPPAFAPSPLHHTSAPPPHNLHLSRGHHRPKPTLKKARTAACEADSVITGTEKRTPGRRIGSSREEKKREPGNGHRIWRRRTGMHGAGARAAYRSEAHQGVRGARTVGPWSEARVREKSEPGGGHDVEWVIAGMGETRAGHVDSVEGVWVRRKPEGRDVERAASHEVARWEGLQGRREMARRNFSASMTRTSYTGMSRDGHARWGRAEYSCEGGWRRTGCKLWSVRTELSLRNRRGNATRRRGHVAEAPADAGWPCKVYVWCQYPSRAKLEVALKAPEKRRVCDRDEKDENS